IAGGDAILVPSRFEPCGLTQLYGLRYGTLPLVALTGGLADTVINASPAALSAEVATGVQFHPVTQGALDGALHRLCDLYAQPKVWAKMQRNAQKQAVGWDRSAAAYARLYEQAVSRS
ncbi:MAG: starch synthase, partial [Primorskyibacter sp.]